jgi:hypothetical protein
LEGSVLIINGRTVAVIKSRRQAGEAVKSIAIDYDLTEAQVATILRQPDPLEAALNRRGIVGESINAALLETPDATVIN